MSAGINSADMHWREAVEDEFTSIHCSCADVMHNPRTALNKLICLNIEIALDPAVSSDAAALVQQGRDEVVKRVSEATGLPVEQILKTISMVPA